MKIFALIKSIVWGTKLRVAIATFVAALITEFGVNSRSHSIHIFPDKSEKLDVLNIIHSAKETLDVAVYRIDDDDFRVALVDAKKRGVRVRVLINDYDLETAETNVASRIPFTASKVKNNKETFDFFEKNSVNVFLADKDRFFLAHQKYMIIDNNAVFLGTYNFNESGLSNRNASVHIKSSSLADVFRNVFEHDIEGRQFQGDLPDNVLVAPNNYFRLLYKMLSRAKRSIIIYQIGISDEHTCDILSVISETIPIKIITTTDPFGSTSMSKGTDYCFSLFDKHPNIEVRKLDKPFYVHAKIVIVDSESPLNSRTLVGSSNFGKESFFESREVGVIFRSPVVAQEISATFENDWQKSYYVPSTPTSPAPLP